MKQCLLLASILLLFVSSLAFARTVIDPDRIPPAEEQNKSEGQEKAGPKPVYVKGSQVTCTVSIGYFDEKADTMLDGWAEGTAECPKNAIKAAEIKACEKILKTKNKSAIKKCAESDLSYEGVSCNIGGVDVDCFYSDYQDLCYEC
ncbi:MAG: hypothetical protein FWC40_02260 [Proteobacteria bacterium]|nr:hypothetical protein [Pseudomonadota bacterium]